MMEYMDRPKVEYYAAMEKKELDLYQMTWKGVCEVCEWQKPGAEDYIILLKVIF